MTLWLNYNLNVSKNHGNYRNKIVLETISEYFYTVFRFQDQGGTHSRGEHQKRMSDFRKKGFYNVMKRKFDSVSSILAMQIWTLWINEDFFISVTDSNVIF